MRWISRLTTVAVVLVVIAGAALFIKLKTPDQKVGGGFVTYAKFRDGAKLAVGSPVVIAGVRVGEITRLGVDGGFARVDMRLQDGLELPRDSFATRRADSLFGDSYVEIIPGGEPGGVMKSGEPIAHIVEGSSTDSLLRGIDRSLPRIDNALDTMHDAMLFARKRMNGAVTERAAEAADWLAEGHVEGPLEKADKALVHIDELTSRAADTLAHTAPTVFAQLDRIDRGVARARSGMADMKTGISGGLRTARESFDRIDEPVQQVAEVVTAINSGSGDDWKGTLGRLVNDPHLADQIQDATEGIASATANFNRFKSWLGMRAEFNVFSKQTRFYAIAEIRAKQDKFYLVEFERGPLGGVPVDRLSDLAAEDSYIRSQQIHDTTRFTAQFGKQFGPISLRGGLKDSTFGFGTDAYLFDARLKLSADIFGSFQPTPRVKLTAALKVFRTLYVMAGVDDALNTPGYLDIRGGATDVPASQFEKVRYGRDYFFGGMLSFTDEDITTLLRIYGVLLVGLL